MKAITLHQPHAHLVGIGAKPFETRSWKTDYRGLLAIHASRIQADELDGLVIDPNSNCPEFIYPFDEYLPGNWNDYFGNLNHGGIECICRLEACIPAPHARRALIQRAATTRSDQERTWLLHSAEFGNFGPGRWAWRLTTLAWLQGATGLVRGYQGLWNLPANQEFQIRALCASVGNYLPNNKLRQLPWKEAA